MALTQISSATASGLARTQFIISSRSAGSDGLVYTVPAGEAFTGYFYMENPASSSYTTIKVNGINISVGYSTSGTWYAFPIYLTSGDVLSNNSTMYFTLTGYLE